MIILCMRTWNLYFMILAFDSPFVKLNIHMSNFIFRSKMIIISTINNATSQKSSSSGDN